ncbi:hypothetical protein CR513_42830, partial [Mucuna pruriens]
MRSLQTVKEVQQLVGRITALSRFLSQSSEMAIPIFNILKKGESFAWTTESEEALLRLKAMLATPLTLKKSTLGIPLLVYIFVSNDVINAAIVQEREGRVLQDAERRYQRIEKAALALIISSRRPHPYFQGYNIVLWTDLPIKQVLRKSDLAGGMVTWSIQLSEFDISYENRGHIKA